MNSIHITAVVWPELFALRTVLQYPKERTTKLLIRLRRCTCCSIELLSTHTCMHARTHRLWNAVCPYLPWRPLFSQWGTFLSFARRFKSYGHFRHWPRTDRQTLKVIIGHSSNVNLSIGRIGRVFCGSCDLYFLVRVTTQLYTYLARDT